MQATRPLSELTFVERLNFLLTNRIPRQAATRLMGWFSKVQNPIVRDMSIGAWKLFVDDLRLHEARKSTFESLHDCFVRELKPGARPVDTDPDILVSPCDAVIGQFGAIDDEQVIQAKGFPYSIAELIGDANLAGRYHNGRFVTLRLKSSMYHHFHAPCAAHIRELRYISGDTWNVNPIALKVVEQLFCRNERAVIDLDINSDTEAVMLVPVAAILVASMRLRGIAEPLNLVYRGPNTIPCDLSLEKGEKIGHFEHGSTIIMLTSPGFDFDDRISTGAIIRMGQPLMRRQPSAPKHS